MPTARMQIHLIQTILAAKNQKTILTLRAASSINFYH
jgi:hypothetical protein